MVVVVTRIFFKGYAHLTLGNLFSKLLQYELTIFFNVCQEPAFIINILLIQARKFVNPAVLCLGKLGYALAKTKVQNLLGKNYPLRPVWKAVEEGGLGEDNVIREFKSDIEGGKHKQRALTFRRTVIPSYLRKRLDEGNNFFLATFYKLI